MNLINGKYPIERYKELYNFNSEKKILIIRFSQDQTEKHKGYIASDISTSEKIKTLHNFSINVNYHAFNNSLTMHKLNQYINEINSNKDIAGVIFQNPIPKKFHNPLQKIDLKKDLDAWSGKGQISNLSITVEAVYRLLKPYFNRDLKVSIVGSKGFIGNRIYNSIKDKFKNLISLDINDNLTHLRDSDIIISSAGVIDLIKEKDLSNSHLLGIDIGCNVTNDLKVRGDFDEKTYPLFEYLSPSPGGVGPLSMAILIERIYTILTGKEIKKWIFNGNEIIL